MNARAIAVHAAIVLVCMIPAAGQAITAYNQNFEALVQTDSDALSADGWLIYGNVYAPDETYLYGYGAFPAPNHNLAFCQIVLDQGGPDQGDQQLVVFSDYENRDRDAGNIIESNVFQEQTIALADVGTAWVFSFDAKLGNIEGASTATAFIKTLDPSSGYATTNLISEDMTSILDTWTHYRLGIEIDASLEGQIIQFGFANLSTYAEGSGIYYDNLDFSRNTIDVPSTPAFAGATMDQNYPNPFNPMTRIDFSLEKAGTVDVSVYDLAGRRVATVFRGQREAGDHHVNWDGKTDTGNAAPAGQYRYVLKTESGQLSRSMMLLK